MTNYLNSDSKLVESSQNALFGLTVNEDLKQQMLAYGFTAEWIQQGVVRLAAVNNILKTRDQHYDAVRELSLKIDQDIDTAYNLFRTHVAIAKIAFREEPHIIQSLNVQKAMGKKWKWIPQALNFYNKTQVHMVKLKQFGADEQWQQNQAATEALMMLKTQRMRKKADSQNSTQEKSQAIEDLKAWYADFRRVARTAFHHTPQILETFGIAVPSTRKNRKATAPTLPPTDSTVGAPM